MDRWKAGSRETEGTRALLLTGIIVTNIFIIFFLNNIVLKLFYILGVPFCLYFSSCEVLLNWYVD